MTFHLWAIFGAFWLALSAARAVCSTARLEAGGVFLNEWFAEDFKAPHGGYKLSGLGREDGFDCVPLIFRVPGTGPGETDALCEMNDLYARLMELTGLEPKHHQRGQSLVPAINGGAAPPRDAVFAEGGRLAGEDHWGIEGLSPENWYAKRRDIVNQNPDVSLSRCAMIRTRDFRYTYCTNDVDELFDLRRDPDGVVNVAPDPDYGEVRDQLTPAVQLNNSLFYTGALIGVFISYIYSGQTYLRTLWIGKALGVVGPSYVMAQVAGGVMIAMANNRTEELVLPGPAVIVHMLVVVPVFIAAAVGLIGFAHRRPLLPRRWRPVDAPRPERRLGRDAQLDGHRGCQRRRPRRDRLRHWTSKPARGRPHDGR